MNRKIARNILLVAIIALAFIMLFLVIKIFAQDARVDDMNYLLVGIDDAGDNTDVMAIVSIKNNKLSILQIPRDTYLNFGHYQNKLNQYYSYRKAKSDKKKAAMGELTELISSQLGVRLDGFIALKTKSFSEIIDRIGGVSVELARDITVNIDGSPALLKKGENTIYGKEALALVRHRASYKGGDLERLEVQRCVYRGIISSLFSKCTNLELISLVRSLSKSLVVNIPVKDAFSLLSRRGDIDYTGCEFNMLKGEAVRDERGIWYYALKRGENEALLNKLYGVEPWTFDKNRLFLNNNNDTFVKIYNS